MITRKILEPGDEVQLVAKRMYDICFSNDQGGTESAPPGKYWVTVEKVWHDYETGWRATGRLNGQQATRKLRKLGTTGQPPKADWDPAHVMFEGEL